MIFPPMSSIREMRKTLDVTQTELAHRSGISQSTIAKIESGKSNANYDTVVNLFETLESMRHDLKKDLTAADVASTRVLSVNSNSKVHMATELMRTEGFSQLPVLDNGVPVGSVSERGIFELFKGGMTMEQLKEVRISDIMEESFPVVNESTLITAVSTMMSNGNAVLVSKKGRIVGMITNADMIKLI